MEKEVYKDYLEYLYRSGVYSRDEMPSFESFAEDFAESDEEYNTWTELNKDYNIEERAKDEQWDLNQDADDTARELFEEGRYE